MRLAAALMILSFSGVRAEWIKPKNGRELDKLVAESRQLGRPMLIAYALH